MNNLAIIPARSGSKGLKDKNIRILDGKPLIAYSILAAIESGMFSKVMVSTDSEKYADISRKYGAEVPFLRSVTTSSDTASSWDVVSEVLDKYAENGERFDSIMLLQPTSPLRTVDNIIDAFVEMENKDANAVISLCEMEHSPLQSNRLPPDLSLDDFIRPENKGKRRQDMETYFRFNGAIYLLRVDYFLQNRGNMFRENCYAYIMDKRESVDIDDEYDFILAEAIMKNNK